jgi:hypothetical protein
MHSHTSAIVVAGSWIGFLFSLASPQCRGDSHTCAGACTVDARQKKNIGRHTHEPPTTTKKQTTDNKNTHIIHAGSYFVGGLVDTGGNADMKGETFKGTLAKCGWCWGAQMTGNVRRGHTDVLKLDWAASLRWIPNQAH